MSVTIGGLELTRLTVQPFGYEESGTRDGLTARKWLVTGLCNASEWADLLEEYESWRNDRIKDPDSVAANDVGSTIPLTATANGMTWSGVQCWFIKAPDGQQLGPYVQATVELVDAAQALEVALAEKKKREDTEDLPDLGVFVLGGAQIKLTRPPDTFQDVPQMQLNAAGATYISGPLGATVVKNIEGTTDQDGWDALLAWVASTTQTTPNVNGYFPLSAPTSTARNKVVINELNEQEKIIEYTVNISLGVTR